MRWDQQTAKRLREGVESRGRWAEDQAEQFLKTKGFKPLAKRAKTQVGEIDLIAKGTDILVFVEVKYRETLDEGLYSILPKQQARIARAAEVWLANHTELSTFGMRFDAIIVNADGISAHIEDAFRPEF